MTIFVLIREDQNEHGFVDTSIAGVFQDASAAQKREVFERRRARDSGLIVEDDDSLDGEWQVSWAIQKHHVS
ncbi:MAG: hypothetical protein WD873_05315 [Candidatus Hydrogenedentales bacterium]